MEFFGKAQAFLILIMNKYILLILVSFISSCVNENNAVDEPIIISNVDWSNSNTCNSSQDNIFINKLINKMTLEQKVGQIIMPDIDEVSSGDVKEYYLGTFLNGGGKFPNKKKDSTVKDWKKLSKDFYEASPVVDGFLVPILWGTDAVHGHNNVIGATIFPHNIGLGSTMNPDLIKTIGSIVAKELLSTGIPWTFAPTIAVPQNDLWGRTYEGYSENPELVARMGEAMILGLQGEGDEFLDSNHVLATAKHFLGDGGTQGGVDQGNTILSEEDFKNIHGTPYYSAINSCIQTVMASFNSWNGIKMHGNEYLLSNILRDQMGFKGLVVGDWNGHSQIPGCSKESCPESFNAGVDIFMAPDDWKVLYKNTLAQVKSGVISEERLDDAVKNILKVKYLLGLFDERKPHEYAYNFIGSEQHREVARQAVRESMVLLKNNSNTLPIKSNKHILVIGNAARQIKYQMGGWTISWQGRDNLNTDFPDTLSIFESLKLRAEAIGSTIEYSDDSSYITKPDLVIFVYGEDPYAEGDGDRKSLFYINPNKRYLSYMKDIKNENIPSVSFFLSGRPLIINQELNLSDAFVQLWLPGTAVEGVSDIIFTDSNDLINFDFKGKLSFSWPKLSSQVRLNFGDKLYDPLFEFGYGLNYRDNTYIDIIKTEEKASNPDEIIVFLGSAYPSYHEVVSYYDLSKEKEIYEGVSADIFSDLKSKINLSKFDFKKQDDAKNLNFGNKNINKTWNISSGTVEDISYMSEGSVQIIMRAKNLSKDNMYLNFACNKNDNQINLYGNTCFKKFTISENFSDTNLNQWQLINIPLKCFDDQDFELSAITTRAQLQTKGNWNIDIHSIKYINNQGYNSCKIYSQDYE
jgi:beta-glucosidase|tara:strand:- start:8196 stop:10778 length:2583 start_codon:yes stop_codon:yes gene_type:complete